MENEVVSKAIALFNFLINNFDPKKELGTLKFEDILKIIKFIEMRN